MLSQLINAEDPLLAEVMVIEVLAQDDMEHGQADGSIGAGTQLQVIGSAGAKPGEARIDGDELGSTFHEVNDGMAIEPIGV